MRFALHRGATDVDTDLTVIDGAQFFGRAAGGVIERDSHALKSTGPGAFRGFREFDTRLLCGSRDARHIAQ